MNITELLTSEPTVLLLCDSNNFALQRKATYNTAPFALERILGTQTIYDQHSGAQHCLSTVNTAQPRFVAIRTDPSTEERLAEHDLYERLNVPRGMRCLQL